MKLKYYMRGLGIGMVVTAFILSVVLDKDTKTMSDNEIMARARELGMVESTVLSQIAEQNKDVSGESNNSEDGSDETDVKETETSETETVETETPETEVPETEPTGTDTPETGITPETENNAEDKEAEQDGGGSETVEIITIVITPGESSESVSRSLEEAGLVLSAKNFDKYLCDSGYDDVIAVGTYEIAVGMTEEEIAKIITKRK